MEKIRTANPNGANGTTSDPREQKCWDIYVANLAKGNDNAYKAAKEAGYSEDSARNVTVRDWFRERLRKLKRREMYSKAERNLDKVLDTKYESDEGKIIPEVMRIVVDVSKTVVTTLGKEDYSTRTETDLTSKGERISITFDESFKNEIASEAKGDCPER